MIHSLQQITFPDDGVPRLLLVRAANAPQALADELRVALRGMLPRDTVIAVAPADMTVELLDEEAMRQHGWVRAPKA